MLLICAQNDVSKPESLEYATIVFSVGSLEMGLELAQSMDAVKKLWLE